MKVAALLLLLAGVATAIPGWFRQKNLIHDMPRGGSIIPGKCRAVSDSSFFVEFSKR